MNKGNGSVIFGAVADPKRAGWPVHGTFVKMGGDGQPVSESWPIFSVAAGRVEIKKCLESGMIDGDRAGALDNALVAASLPTEETRYDLIIGHSEMIDRDVRLISVFSGARPPEEGSGLARFVRCTDAEHCNLPNCARYPAHGVLFPEHINIQVGSVIFSAVAGRNILERGVKGGIFLPAEAERIMVELQTAGFVDIECDAEGITRADRIMMGVMPVDPALGVDVLNVMFDLCPAEKPARFDFCHCGKHTALYGINDHEILSGLPSRYDARLLVENAAATGVISNDERTRLLEEVSKLNLSEGSKAESAVEMLISTMRGGRSSMVVIEVGLG